MNTIKQSFRSLSKRIGTVLEINDTPQTILPFPSQYSLSSKSWPPHELLALMLLQFLALVFLWNFLGSVGTLLLFPFSFMSVLFHELGHAFMAIITGGKVLSIKIGITADNGLTTFAGGWECLVLPAGYLFSTFLGAFMLFCSFSEYLSFIFVSVGGIFSSGFLLFFSDDIPTFLLSLLSLSGFILALKFYKEKLIVFWVSFAGMACCFIASSSILSSLIIYQNPITDGYRFSQQCLFIVPPVLVGVSWLCFSLLFPFFFLYLRVRQFRVKT